MSTKVKPVAAHVPRNLKHQHEQALAANVGVQQHDREITHGPRGPPRLIGKPEVIDKTSLSYPLIWRLMRQGKFPRSRIIQGRVLWVEAEVDDWIAKLPLQALKGDRRKRQGRGYFNIEQAR
jgi:prophage regulatory protein